MKRFKAAFLVVLLSLIVVRYISADERLKFQAKPHQAKRRLLAVPGSGIADLDDDDQSEATIQESLESELFSIGVKNYMHHACTVNRGIIL